MCKLPASDTMLLLRRHHYIFLDSLSKTFSAFGSLSIPYPAREHAPSVPRHALNPLARDDSTSLPLGTGALQESS
jgi:hypothetical protein